jgi:pimeloyl-ACP methyl ester carboxylesterase
VTANWLLLHGTPLTPAVWDVVRPLLLGETTAPPVRPGGGRADEVQAQLALNLAASMPPGVSWHVVGHSFGGQVALEFAIQRPDLVSSLTLLCTRDTPYRPFGAMSVQVDDIDIDASLRRWFSPDELAANGPAVRYARTTLDSADRTAWARALDAIAVFDCSARTRSIACPTAVIAAGHDPVSPPAAMTALSKRLPHAVLTILNDAWHMSVFADPHRLAGLLLRNG